MGDRKMIQGVKVKKLKLIPDDRGRLMEILRRDDEMFQVFGQVYMTTAYPGVVKAWHYHKKQTDNFTCIRGKMRLGLYDPRKDSPSFGQTEEYVISLDNPMVVQIPPEVYHGFKCISDEEAVVINTVTRPYDPNDPDEYRVDAYENDIDFDWRK
ncbi:MAG: dTDP-4-dehydrorhamnose 3,5-epimerase family protein [Candidatus Omnitrophica bacterium]|nr:dTDP-4-dehydrorhamnose 3,5-epimerase family protein [Candidatus Omnitrophota bacterium]